MRATDMQLRKKEFKRFLPLLCLGFVLLTFLFFRFYNLDKKVIFDWDQERDATVIRELIVEKKPTLIGPRVLGPEGFFLGPYFTYLLAPFYLITALHPKSLMLFLITYNLTFFAVCYWVLRKIFNQSTALIFLLVWSIHPSLVGIDFIVWNPLLIPLFVVMFWFFTFWAFKKNIPLSWLTLGFLAGIGVNFHFQLIFLIPFALVFLISLKKNILKNLFLFLVGSLVSFVPLLLFDLRHNFINSKLLLDFFLKRGGGFAFLAWLPVWRNIVQGFLGFDFILAPLFFYFLILGLTFWLWKKEKNQQRKMFFFATGVTWLIFPLGFSLFGQRPSEYYFNYLHLFFLLILVISLLKTIKNRLLIIILILIFLTFRFDRMLFNLQPNPLGLYYKDRVIQKIAKIGRGKRFNVSFSVPLGMDTGYRYLMNYYQINQTQDPDDPLIQIVIPAKKNNEVFGGIGLDIPDGFQI